MFPPHDSKSPRLITENVFRSMNSTTVSSAFNFPEEEEKVLKFWREIDAFQTSLRLSEGRPVYSFYDGPPFATGLPHYGHLLAGTIKVRNVSSSTSALSPTHVPFAHRRRTVTMTGHRHAPRTRLRLPRAAPLWLGHARRTRRARD
jgi:hypothetical protein